ncbi:MAG: methylated-DNA--[protein]-cysteine S-methyltransferase [Acidobacteria bacterium]|nr:methylated-DNA--[protein]-cysteine S-methyltransferase [Acidobacteriota bacterium]
MTCDEFVTRLDDLVAGDDAGRVKLELGRHADRCPACRDAWQHAAWLERGLLSAAASDEPALADIRDARNRLRGTLDRAGYPPIRFGAMSTPIGIVFIGLTDRGVCDLTFGQRSERAYRAALLRRAPEVWRDDAELSPVVEQLRAYFAGALTQFTVPVDLRQVTPFTARVLDETRKIRFGRLSSYGAVAAGLGTPGASRAVGGALGRNPVPIIVPCHRVLAQGGRIGGFTGGVATKRILLGVEGHQFAEFPPRLF